MNELSARSSFLQQLGVITRKLRTFFDGRIKRQGLTLARARLLITLSDKEGMTQKELAQLLAVEQPSLVTLIDAMEKNGFIRRVAIEGDRRSKGILPTDLARKKTAELLASIDEANEVVLAGIEDAELEVARRVIQRISDNINRVV